MAAGYDHEHEAERRERGSFRYIEKVVYAYIAPNTLIKPEYSGKDQQ